MKAFPIVLVLLAFASGASARVIDVAAIEKKLDSATRARLSSYQAGAMRGDYQAMRNLAFTWSTDAARTQPDASIVGCAWYAQIMQMHTAKVHVGDVSNRDLYCGRLSKQDLQAAAGLFNALGESIGPVVRK